MSQKKAFQKMYISLAYNYGSNIDEARLLSVTESVEKTIGLDHNWDAVFKSLVVHETYFPNIAVISKYLTIPQNLDTPKAKAMATVEAFVGYLTGTKDYAEFPEGFLAYWKKKFNADKFSYNHGDIKLEFERRKWVDIAAHEFEHGVNENLKIESPKVLELCNSTLKGKVINEQDKTT